MPLVLLLVEFRFKKIHNNMTDKSYSMLLIYYWA